MTEHHEHNKMTVHNMATVITPNLFRPFELTANDLIFAQHLVETFKIMMNEYRVIFSVTEEEEDMVENTIKMPEVLQKPLIVEDDVVGEVF